ncbi:hypothetical protein EUA03_17605 [Mycolicibacterium mucogenicum]|uniref:Uncharacterized protein n=2 Tax=Mycolicibacterium mucogenicum TaxID=56689 RepID=A0A4R5WCV3_MYCMU|nr:hypothetical protein [Mycolicibacterium mucogenicum]TDK87394.1 hypothetical protein EUA03_17605 [Mycolicibacterium mucogenicum]
MRMKKTAVTTAVAGALFAGAAGVGTGLAAAGMTPPLGPTVTAPPAWAPPKPAEPAWSMGNPQVWDARWNHWGVWVNGTFVPTF